MDLLTVDPLPGNRERRLILEVRFGPRQGDKSVLEPGQSLRVGRALPADLVVSADDRMSPLHCEISWVGRRCRVRDLGSAQGTLLNGERVDAGEVRHGSWIRAGNTLLMIYVEEHTPPRRGSRVDMTGIKARALAALAAADQPLFAVLDAARGERIRELCRESVEPYRSLYEGMRAEPLADVAPYLVRLSRQSRLLEHLVREGWGRRWGIYLTCPRPFRELRTHLRRLLMVENQNTGMPMYFRFYDPMGLRVFLAGCTPRQRAELYGDISSFWVEERDGAATRHPR
jgi:pSer/pThr/pTyr-binding forkhead associated (FHA) protein